MVYPALCPSPLTVRDREADASQDRSSPEPIDPFEDADALEELGHEITTLAAHIHAATQRLLELIAEFDERRGWELGGYRSCAHWLAARTGIDMGAAREKVRTARALVGLPEISGSMARGELSFSAVRALTRVATVENEAPLLELARGATAAQIEKVVRGWKRGSRDDEAAWERECWESRRFAVFPDEDGMYVVKGRLPAEVGALLMRAIEAASDALYREERAVTRAAAAAAGAGRSEKAAAHAGAAKSAPRVAVPVEAAEESARAAARRRADAVGLIAERALAAGFRPEDGVPVSGTRAERYQVVLHVERATLESKAKGEPTESHLEDGTRVSAETSRRLCCDTARVDMEHDAAGSILHVGRRTRTIPPALRRALEARDRGCRFPSCGSRFTDGHHVIHWADGGETSLANCLLLCLHHHRLVHEGGWQIQWWGEGRPAFFDPRGGTHFEGRWQPPEVGDRPVDALIARNRERDVRPDGWTAGARWEREADIPDSVLLGALEAGG